MWRAIKIFSVLYVLLVNYDKVLEQGNYKTLLDYVIYSSNNSSLKYFLKTLVWGILGVLNPLLA